MEKRPYDVVCFGATGFTGFLTAKYLLDKQAAGGLFTFAIAGRSAEKLKQIQQRLGSDVPVIVADTSDAASLAAMTAQCRAIATTVGPYLKYGAALVAACVSTGTHYADLTGEPPFIREMIDQHHEEAQRMGAKIVNCCGFDCIPTDLGVFLATQTLQESGSVAAKVKTLVTVGKGGASGGTLDSAGGILTWAKKDPTRFSMLKDPYFLVPGLVLTRDIHFSA
jgi:short subunit dehydrogenase-like uncharacterized protein